MWLFTKFYQLILICELNNDDNCKNLVTDFFHDTHTFALKFY